MQTLLKELNRTQEEKKKVKLRLFPSPQPYSLPVALWGEKGVGVAEESPNNTNTPKFSEKCWLISLLVSFAFKCKGRC